jgi:hypothetical protein
MLEHDMECDEMPRLITHERESFSPRITNPGATGPTVHLPTHRVRQMMYEST